MVLYLFLCFLFPLFGVQKIWLISHPRYLKRQGVTIIVTPFFIAFAYYTKNPQLQIALMDWYVKTSRVTWYTSPITHVLLHRRVKIMKGGRGYLCFFNNKCWLYRIACGGKDVILQLNIN